MNDKIYIHYGAPHFESTLFAPIKNMVFFSKPVGGLWASDINSAYGWVDWMEDNDYLGKSEIVKHNFKFKLTPEARVLTITSKEQLNDLPHIVGEDAQINGKSFDTWQLLDFEKLAQQYDAIEVILSADRYLYFELYGWDCDSILIMNKDVIVEIP